MEKGITVTGNNAGAVDVPKETIMTNPEAAQVLTTNVANLPERDQAFALSLLAAAARGRATEKQLLWIGKLAERIATPEVPKTLGDFAKLLAIFEVASQHLKRPTIRVRLQDGRTLKLYRAGAMSKAPGAINVKDDRGEWYGRVVAGGQWQGRATTDATVIETVRQVAESPAAFLGANGRLTGHCCFCGLALTDQRSLEVGYGKICAGNYNLPWGQKLAA